MMQARLQDGSVVTLVKDCDCTLHDGPHWLHVDETARNIFYHDFRLPIEAIVAKGAAATTADVHHAEALFLGYCQRERARLRDKISHMKRAGIVELLPDTLRG